MKKDSFCSHCGDHFTTNVYPKTCNSCAAVTYVNPLPVTVALIPVIDGKRQGLVTIRRSIEPFIGSLALPGGYLERGETWQEGCAREVMEETGIILNPNEIVVWHLETAPSNSNLLIFCNTTPISLSWLETSKPFSPNSEVSEMVIIWEPTELAFPTHTNQSKLWLELI